MNSEVYNVIIQLRSHNVIQIDTFTYSECAKFCKIFRRFFIQYLVVNVAISEVTLRQNFLTTSIGLLVY